MKLRLLVINRDTNFLNLCAAALAESSTEILTATNEVEGLEVFLRSRPQIVILDANATPVSGIEVLSRFSSVDPGVAVILLADRYSSPLAVNAIRLGATDYLPKPVDMASLQSRVHELRLEAERRSEALSLERELIENYQFEGIIGRSPLMLDLFSRIRRVAPHFRVLLIRGETGTGKELVARALHNRGQGHGKRFVACNCSAIVDTLLETELFGHIKGAFTGADRDKVGLFEYAEGGTVFLDEIGDMPLGAQAKLLRVLQNNEIQRVGSPKVYPVNARVVAASNRNLKVLVDQSKFREDLYYRLAMVELELPSLSQRMDDLPLLVRYFLEKYSRQYKKEVLGLTRRAQRRMCAYSWPGNVRELENVIANTCMMAEGKTLDVADLPDFVTKAIPSGSVPDTMEKVQENHLLYVLVYTGGNKARAAEILDISRETVYSILARISLRFSSPSVNDTSESSGKKSMLMPNLSHEKSRKR